MALRLLEDSPVQTCQVVLWLAQIHAKRADRQEEEEASERLHDIFSGQRRNSGAGSRIRMLPVRPSCPPSTLPDKGSNLLSDGIVSLQLGSVEEVPTKPSKSNNGSRDAINTNQAMVEVEH